MNKATALCILKGLAFSPSLLRAKLGLCLAETNEPGDTGQIGRYKGQPIPFGAAKIEFAQSQTGSLEDAISFLEENIMTLKKSGAEEILLYLLIEHDGQCDFELGPEIIRRIAVLNVPLLFSSFRHDGTN